MPTELIVAVITSAFSLAAGVLGTRNHYKGEIAKLKEARRGERERSFDVAKTGYRALYRKLAEHYKTAASTGDGFDAVSRDIDEAQMVGFKPLNAALDRFWPKNDRRAGHPPSEHHWDGVTEAFQRLAGLTLEEWESAQKPDAST